MRPKKLNASAKCGPHSFQMAILIGEMSEGSIVFTPSAALLPTGKLTGLGCEKMEMKSIDSYRPADWAFLLLAKYPPFVVWLIVRHQQLKRNAQFCGSIIRHFVKRINYQNPRIHSITPPFSAASLLTSFEIIF